MAVSYAERPPPPPAGGAACAWTWWARTGRAVVPVAGLRLRPGRGPAVTAAIGIVAGWRGPGLAREPAVELGLGERQPLRRVRAAVAGDAEQAIGAAARPRRRGGPTESSASGHGVT